MAQLITSTNNRKQAVLSQLYNLSMYNLATGKLKKKYVTKTRPSTLEKIQADFKQLV